MTAPTPPRLAERVRRMTPSMTLAISARANALRRAGVDVLPFSAGEPDFDTPEFIKDAARDALARGFTKYTPVAGTARLRAAAAAKLQRDHGLDYRPAEVLISCGAKHSVANAIAALVNPGDEVVIPAPYWVSYPEMVTLADGVSRFVPTAPEHDFCPTPAALAAALSPRTRVVILNTPGNPTGGAWSRAQFAALAEVLAGRDLWVISDEIYEKLLYDGRAHTAYASLSPDCRARTITVNGVSKTYAMTGWRIGYAAGPQPVIEAMEAIQSHVTSGATSIAQEAAAAALEADERFLAPLLAAYDRRRRRLVAGLNALPGVQCRMPGGAFFAFPRVADWYGRRLGGVEVKDSLTFCEACLNEAHLAFVPGEGFGADDFIRVSYACSDEQIDEGLRRLGRLLGGAGK